MSERLGRRSAAQSDAGTSVTPPDRWPLMLPSASRSARPARTSPGSTAIARRTRRIRRSGTAALGTAFVSFCVIRGFCGQALTALLTRYPLEASGLSRRVAPAGQEPKGGTGVPQGTVESAARKRKRRKSCDEHHLRSDGCGKQESSIPENIFHPFVSFVSFRGSSRHPLPPRHYTAADSARDRSAG